MRKFLLGFAAGVATYHFVLQEVDTREMKAELRSFIQQVDQKLAEEKDVQQESTTVDEGPQNEEEGRVDVTPHHEEGAGS